MSADIPYLQVLDGPLKGTQFRLVGESAIIGRSAECDVRLEGVKGVSRQHAQILLSDSRLFIKDLDSQNGTLVDGKKISEALVSSGGKIKIGQVTMRAHIPASALPATRTGASLSTSAESASPIAAAPGEIQPAAHGHRAPGTDSEALMLAAAEGSRSFLFTLLCLVVGLGGGLYAVNALLTSTAKPHKPHWIVAVGESQVIATKHVFSSWKTKGVTDDGSDTPYIEVNEYKGYLEKAIKEMNDRNRTLKTVTLNFLVVKGNHEGDAQLILYNKAGKPVDTLDILIRGTLPPKWGADRLPPNEALAQADEAVREAALLQEDDYLYLSIRRLERARELYKVAGEAERDRLVYRKIGVLTDQLREDLSTRFTRALALAFPNRKLGQKPNYQAAFQALENVKRLVPDDTSPDWQIIERWQAEIRRIVISRP